MDVLQEGNYVVLQRLSQLLETVNEARIHLQRVENPYSLLWFDIYAATSSIQRAILPLLELKCWTEPQLHSLQEVLTVSMEYGERWRLGSNEEKEVLLSQFEIVFDDYQLHMNYLTCH